MAAVASGVALFAGSGVTVGQVKAVAELALVMAQIVSVVKKMKTPDDQSVRDAVRAGGELGLEARRGSGVDVSVVPADDNESDDPRGSGDSGSRAVSDSEETARFMEVLLREAKVEVKSGDDGDGDGDSGAAAGDGGDGFRVTIGGASVDLDSPGLDEEVELDNINLDDLDTLLQDGDGDSLGSMITRNLNKDK